jgi:flagella basal body P-ring formation protein FlgA
MIRALALLTLITGPAFGEIVTPTHTIRANTVISVDDLKMTDITMPGAISNPLEIAGLEAKRNLYAGRPIRANDVGPAALIERNQIVALRYNLGGLFIETEGRALERAAIGDFLRVLNLSSRNTVSGRVDKTGAVLVGN